MTIAEIIGPLLGIIIIALLLVGYQRINTLHKNYSGGMRAPCPGCGAKGVAGKQSGKAFRFLCSFCGHTWFR